MNSFLLTLHRKPLLGAVAWTIAAFVLYGNTLGHGFALDDDLVIGLNRYVQQGFGGIAEIFVHSHTHGATGLEDQGYRPLPLTVFAVTHALAGNAPGAYHFLNVFAYGLAVALFFRLLAGHSDRIPLQAGVLVAALYLVHPVHTEVVANVKGFEDILLFMLCMTLLLQVRHYVSSGRVRHLVFAAGWFGLALLTKEIAITFLAVVPAYLYTMTGAPRAVFGRTVAAMVAVFALFWALRSAVLSGAQDVQLTVLNNGLVAADHPLDRLATALWMQAKYLLLFVFPHPLSSDYSFNQVPLATFASIRGIAGGIIVLGLAVMAAYGIWKKRVFGFGLLFYLAAMSIVSNVFILIGATMAERFLFTASAGLCIAVIHPLYERLPLVKKAWLGYAMVPVLILLAGRTFQRNKDWQNNETLFRADIENVPNSTRMQMNVARLEREAAQRVQNPQVRQQKLRTAKKHFERSLEILPSNHEAWYNLGLVEEQLGRTEVAIEAYERCIQLAPAFALAYNNLGVIHFNDQRMDRAGKYFLKAYALGSQNADIVANRGLIEHYHGRYREAIGYYEEALALNPRHQGALGNIAKAYQALGDREKVRYYEQRR